jgi:hypothetical protein
MRKESSKNTNLDLIFILDCTGYMDPIVSATKDELKNIIDYIVENNPYSKVRISFVGLPDHCDKNTSYGQFVELDFTDDVGKAISFIETVKACGGGDTPEDVVGGLTCFRKDLGS